MKKLQLSVQEDITAQEALSLTVLMSMILSGVYHPLFEKYDFQWSVDDVQKMFELSLRHWKQDSQVKVDEAGKKHYIMECETGKFGLTPQSIQ